MSQQQQIKPAAPVEKTIPNPIKFLNGGLSGMAATCVVQPLDLVKNRMQLSGVGGAAKEHKTSLHVITSVIRNEGITGIYAGLGAGLLRQASYTTVRMGVYNTVLEAYSKDGKQPNFAAKAGIGMLAGCVGSIFGNPAEISLIRMTSDGRLPAAERRNYTGVVNALTRIVREEGVLTLWRGVIPTMGRAMVVNAAQLASYSQAKELLLNTKYFEDNLKCHFTASTISGFITTVASMPVDIAKTRIQSMKIIDGKPEYKGAIDVLVKVVKNEGVFSLWKGFTPYFSRLAPHSIITFCVLEQLNQLYKSNF